ncbi:SurA N-terminal domain-containing protein [candidate division CSSED10-310 bacterium]|uniref:SurA N-terminal domain-containing protein n=1 Tax=candidate division CSSED10-310 bacterium TaxID=2855610 RepID=A0ABV6Z0R0_UNCC1
MLIKSTTFFPFRRHVLFWSSFLIIIMLLFCVLTILMKRDKFEQQGSNPVIATIGTHSILCDDFLALYRQLYSKQWEMLTAEERKILASELLHTMIQAKIMLAEAKRLGIDKDEKVTSSVDNIIAVLLSGRNQRYIQSEQEYSTKELKNKMIHNFLIMKVKERMIAQEPISVTDADIEQYYQSRPADFVIDKSTVHLKQLVFENTRTGQATFRNLKRGSSFEKEIVRLQKRGQECPELIDIGIIEFDELEPEEMDNISITNEDEYVAFLHRNGEYIINLVVEKKMKGKIELEKVRTKIEEIIRNKKQNDIFQNWMDIQYKKLPVKVYQNIVDSALTIENVVYDKNL